MTQHLVNSYFNDDPFDDDDDEITDYKSANLDIYKHELSVEEKALIYWIFCKVPFKALKCRFGIFQNLWGKRAGSFEIQELREFVNDKFQDDKKLNDPHATTIWERTKHLIKWQRRKDALKEYNVLKAAATANCWMEYKEVFDKETAKEQEFDELQSRHFRKMIDPLSRNYPQNSVRTAINALVRYYDDNKEEYEEEGIGEEWKNINNCRGIDVFLEALNYSDVDKQNVFEWFCYLLLPGQRLPSYPNKSYIGNLRRIGRNVLY